MVERRPLLTVITHLTLLAGVALVAFPIWLAFVASTYPADALMSDVLPLWPGDRFIENYNAIFTSGVEAAGSPPVGLMMFNSLIMALAIACGKIAISIISAFAIVYFRFPLRMTFFWIIFITLMLPVEVRILPTYEVVANLGMLNSYAGLSIPLSCSGNFS
jgi:sn-glycerol 3-phosphate transport system permease protein